MTEDRLKERGPIIIGAFDSLKIRELEEKLRKMEVELRAAKDYVDEDAHPKIESLEKRLRESLEALKPFMRTSSSMCGFSVGGTTIVSVRVS